MAQQRRLTPEAPWRPRKTLVGSLIAETKKRSSSHSPVAFLSPHASPRGPIGSVTASASASTLLDHNAAHESPIHSRLTNASAFGKEKRKMGFIHFSLEAPDDDDNDDVDVVARVRSYTSSHTVTTAVRRFTSFSSHRRFLVIVVQSSSGCVNPAPLSFPRVVRVTQTSFLR